MKRTIAAMIFVTLVGCGSKAKPADTTAMHRDEHANLPAEVVKFHDLLSPKWHAEKGPQRMKDACGAVADFTADADAIVKSAAPAHGDAAKWAPSTKELVDAVAAFKTSCEGTDEAAFDTAFQHMHESFHAVAEAAGGAMGNHDEHKDGDEHHHDDKK
ncbi:MAG: hypothetical protein NT062_05535 [Proteobacteria bacterium]|nr:hypothetical protein [Pseudomonadota bacterium]